MPYIYLIKAHNSGGLHKIGKTIDISRRMRELKASPGDQVEVIQLPSKALMDSVERSLHRQFEAARVPQSEMFNLSAEQVTTCREAMKAVEARYDPARAKPDAARAKQEAIDKANRKFSERRHGVVYQQKKNEQPDLLDFFICGVVIAVPIALLIALLHSPIGPVILLLIVPLIVLRFWSTPYTIHQIKTKIDRLVVRYRPSEYNRKDPFKDQL